MPSDSDHAAVLRRQLKNLFTSASPSRAAIERAIELLGADTEVSYRRADGEDIDGHGWVGELEWFDDDDRPTELIEETWCLLRSRTIVVNPDDIEIEIEADQ